MFGGPHLQRRRHHAAGVSDGLGGDLGLAAKEVVIERALGRPADRNDLVRPGRSITVPAEQHRCRRHLPEDARLLTVSLSVDFLGDSAASNKGPGIAAGASTS